MTESPRHSVSVAAAIFDESGEKVLLIKRRDNGRWEPPGGVLELDETIEEGLRREVREETGAEIEIGPLTGVYKNMARGIVAMVFRCSLQGSPAEDSPEALKVSWVSINGLREVMHEAYAVRLTDAAIQTSTRVRAHDGVNLLSKSPTPPGSDADGA